ncbi:hypothetical protein [Rhodococcus ruber]|uniref:hypothetical protein n=1 Tax=Rhodococcus ruber TaxID=1830 RepID=UPI003782E1FD
MSWSDILKFWRYVELDLQDRGIDVESGILHERSWRWLQLRVIDLVTLPGTRLHTALNPTPQRKGHPRHGIA